MAPDPRTWAAVLVVGQPHGCHIAAACTSDAFDSALQRALLTRALVVTFIVIRHNGSQTFKIMLRSTGHASHEPMNTLVKPLQTL